MAFTEPGGAVLYGPETRALNQAVKRNRDRFPDDFMDKGTLKGTFFLSGLTDIFGVQAVPPNRPPGLPFCFGFSSSQVCECRNFHILTERT